MNGGILPLVLLSATVGLLLSFTIGRVGWMAIVIMASLAAIMAATSSAQNMIAALTLGLLAMTIIAAAITILRPSAADTLVVPLAMIVGIGAGALASSSGRKGDLLLALPLSLLFVPGRRIVANGYGIAIKVVASWMIAIATLSIFVSMTPTPGYEPDHME